MDTQFSRNFDVIAKFWTFFKEVATESPYWGRTWASSGHPPTLENLSNIYRKSIENLSKIYRKSIDVHGCPWMTMDATRNVPNLENRKSKLPHPPKIRFFHPRSDLEPKFL